MNHFKHELLDEDSRYYIAGAVEHNNCALCLAEDRGPMTQEQVGNYLGLTKMRISQIEKIAMKKLKRKLSFILE